MKLTKTVVDKIKPPATGQAFYRDEVMKGFALRVTAAGAKSFVVEKRIGGKTRRKTLGAYGALTVEQARKEAQKFLGKVASGIDPIAEQRAHAARGVTLSEVFETYLKTRSGLTPGTIHDYRRNMREVFRDWQNRPLADISKDEVAKRHAKTGERSRSRANNAMRMLRALFNFARGQYEDAEGRSLFPENPVNRLTHTRAWYRVERRQTFIKRDDLPAWFAAVQALRDDDADPQGRTVADWLLLLLFTGLRRSEGLRLRWTDIDFAARSLTVHQTKNREPLTLPLSDFIFELLSARRALVVASPYVFPGEGRTGYLHEPRPQMRKVTQQSGVAFIPHDLRRTYITVAEGLDISAYALKRLVNHSTGNDVTAGYIISDVERLRAPMQRITDFILDTVSAGSGDKVVPFRAPA